MNVLFAVSSQQLLLPFAVYCMVNSRIELGIQCRPVSQPALLCCQCVGPVTHITLPCRALCEIFSQNQKLSCLVYGGSYMCCVYRVDILLALVPAAIACQISYLYYVHRLYPPIVVIHRAPHKPWPRARCVIRAGAFCPFAQHHKLFAKKRTNKNYLDTYYP